MFLKNRSYSFFIKPQDVDFQEKLTLMSLGNILLSAADVNANENGFGMLRLHKMQCAWALTRLIIEMDVFPRQYDAIEVETWIETAERLTTTRNFCIRNKEGAILGNAASHWVLFDLQTRRPSDLKALEDMRDYILPLPSLTEKPTKMTPIAGNSVDAFTVKYNAIDINMHVNSIRYIEWIGNCFPLETYQKKNIRRFEINYISEMRFGEQATIFEERVAPNDFRFEIRKKRKNSVPGKSRLGSKR